MLRHRPEVRKSAGRWRAWCPSCRSWWSMRHLDRTSAWPIVFAVADRHARTGEWGRP